MVLLRDSVIYFGAVFTILVANVVMWAVGGVRLSHVPV